MQSKKSIYLIDDDEIYTFTMKKILQHSVVDHHINVYGDGEIALEALDQDAKSGVYPDLIFLDIDMPAIDGWEFLEELGKRKINETPVIYVSSSTIDPAEIARAEANELVEGFLAKPISREKLAEICSALD